MLPEIAQDHLARLVKPGKLETALKGIGFIQQYLAGNAVGDTWGSNHEARRKWTSQLVKQYGESFF